MSRFDDDEEDSSRFVMTRRDRGMVNDADRSARAYLAAKRDPNKGLLAGGRTRMKKTDLVIGAGTGFAAAAIVGLIAGRLGTTSIPGTGVPAGGVAAAAALIPLALGVVPQKLEFAALGAGLGALAAWGTMWGAGQGAQQAQTAEQGPRVIAAGYPASALPPVNNARPLSEAEIANMMQGRG